MNWFYSDYIAQNMSKSTVYKLPLADMDHLSSTLVLQKYPFMISSHSSDVVFTAQEGGIAYLSCEVVLLRFILQINEKIDK